MITRHKGPNLNLFEKNHLIKLVIIFFPFMKESIMIGTIHILSQQKRMDSENFADVYYCT